MMPQFTKDPIIKIWSATIRPESKQHFVEWRVKLYSVIVGFDGFVSLEFLSPPEKRAKWNILIRFDTNETALLWNDSPLCKEFLRELQALSAGNKIDEKTEDEVSLNNGITEVIVTQIDPAQEKAYREWSAKIHQIEAKFEGFRGVYIQSPKQNNGRLWITLLQFNSSANLDRWLTSNERREILKEGAPFISSLESHRIISPYAGWFSSIAHTQEVPSAWKQTMIVLLVLFPIVMLEIAFLNPLTTDLGLSLSTFISNAISVTLLAFPMIPIAIALLSWWLYPETKKRWPLTILGTAIVVLLYFIEIGIFRYFFN